MSSETTITPPIRLARRARHRKPNRRRSVITTATTALALAAAATGATGAGQHSADAAYLAPAVHAASQLTWAQRTCDAVLAVQDKASARNVNTLAADAALLTGRTWLRADVYEVLADAASPGPKSRQHLDTALQYAGEDCYGGA